MHLMLLYDPITKAKNMAGINHKAGWATATDERAQLGNTGMIGGIPAKLGIHATQTTHLMHGKWEEIHIKPNIRIICHSTLTKRITPNLRINTGLYRHRTDMEP